MKCEKCGSETSSYRDGHSFGWVCNQCGWECVTSLFEPYEIDQEDYTIVITNNSCSTKFIKVIASVAGVNYLRAKVLLESKNASIFTGKAKDIIEKKRILMENNIAFIITPDFPY